MATTDIIGRNSVDWTAISDALDAEGWAVLPRLLDPSQCRELAGLYDAEDRFRSHIVMARHGFGRGEYKYFSYPLPGVVANFHWRDLGDAGETTKQLQFWMKPL